MREKFDTLSEMLLRHSDQIADAMENPRGVGSIVAATLMARLVASDLENMATIPFVGTPDFSELQDKTAVQATLDQIETVLTPVWEAE